MQTRKPAVATVHGRTPAPGSRPAEGSGDHEAAQLAFWAARVRPLRRTSAAARADGVPPLLRPMRPGHLDAFGQPAVPQVPGPGGPVAGTPDGAVALAGRCVARTGLTGRSAVAG